MFVPLYDENRLTQIRFQYVTVSLIIVNVLVFGLLQGGFGPAFKLGISTDFSVIPAELWTGLFATTAPGMEHAPHYAIPEALTLISYMFLHGSWMHLIGNMLFLWVFGDNVEDCLGHGLFLVFYLLCGIGAGLFHVMLGGMPDVSLIGASGAVAGVIGGYLLLHPHVTVWVLVLWRIPLPVRAVWVLGFWVALQVVSAFNLLPGIMPQNVAWWAHIGGALTGIVLIILLRGSEIRLFDADQVR